MHRLIQVFAIHTSHTDGFAVIRHLHYYLTSLITYCIHPKYWYIKTPYQGPIVQSIVSLTSLLVVKLLTVLLRTISSPQVFFAEKCE